MPLVFAGVCSHAPGITGRADRADPDLRDGLYAGFDRMRQAIEESERLRLLHEAEFWDDEDGHRHDEGASEAMGEEDMDEEDEAAMSGEGEDDDVDA